MRQRKLLATLLLWAAAFLGKGKVVIEAAGGTAARVQLPSRHNRGTPTNKKPLRQRRLVGTAQKEVKHPFFGGRQSTSEKQTTKSKRLKNEQSLSSSRSFYTWYLQSCTNRPFLTKGLTAGFIAALGDFLAQQFEAASLAKVDSTTIPAIHLVLNLQRLLSFFLCGTLYTGPFVHVWYQGLAHMGRVVKSKLGANNLQQLVSQVLVDQTVGVVLFFPLYIVVYDLLEAILLGQLPSLGHAIAKCQTHIRQVILMQYRIFPIANTINFALVPEQLRALFSNSVSLFWNIYLCSIVA